MEPWAVFSLSTSVWSSSLRWKERCISIFIESRFAAVSARADNFFHVAGFSSDVYRQRILVLCYFLQKNYCRDYIDYKNSVILWYNAEVYLNYFHTFIHVGQMKLILTTDVSFHSRKYIYKGFLFQVLGGFQS